jgi:hypothetical protein
MDIYVFIDESGDSGDIARNRSNSFYYAELALQADSQNIHRLCEHITNWRYVRGRFKEFESLPSGSDLSRFLIPVIQMQMDGLIKCSGVYLDKNTYGGRYLRMQPGREINAIYFRNYVHRKLLEFHFSLYPVEQKSIELIFDRYEMSKESISNLEHYLDANWNIPKIKHITHADSVYCEALQLTSQLVNSLKDFVFNNGKPYLKELMRPIPLKEIIE